MRVSEVRALLQTVSALDRRSFPEGAETAWHEVLSATEYQDAHKAVLAYYANRDHNGPISPGELRAGAAWYAERRRRATRELPPAPVRTDRSAMAQEVIREITAAAVERHRAANPDARPYRHRRMLSDHVTA